MVETEESFTKAQFFDAFQKQWNLKNKRQYGPPIFYGVYSDGTRFYWEDELGDRHYGLISDLSSFSIARVGSVNITLGVNVGVATTTDTISPALNDSTLANWRLFACIHQPLAALVLSVHPVLNSTSVIQVKVIRGLSNASLAATNITVAGGDLSDVDVTLSNPHGSDAGVGPHNHTVTTHPVTDPTHSHPLIASSGSAVYTVDWMIVHK